MVSLYYALPKVKESDCQKFNLSVELIPGELIPSLSLSLSLSLKTGDPLIFKMSRVELLQKKT